MKRRGRTLALAGGLALLLVAVAARLAWTTRPDSPAVGAASAPAVAASGVVTSSQAASGTATPAGAPAPAPPVTTLRITLLAGDGHAGLQDGPAAQARFADPYGLARDAAGRLYIADAGENNRIRLLMPEGGVHTLAGGEEGFRDGLGEQARFNTPSGLALDAAGNLYVADTGNHAIRKISPDGRVSTLAGSGKPGFRDGPGAQAQFNGPIGVAVDAAGRVLVADTYNDRIRVIGADGRVSTLAGSDRPGLQDGAGAQARFDTPCALAVDAHGRIWVADTRNDALRRIDVAADGTAQVSTLLRADPKDDEALLRRPLGLAIAADGAVLIAVQRHGALLRMTPQGELRALHDDLQRRLARPSALVAAPDGSLLVADAAAGRIHAAWPLAMRASAAASSNAKGASLAPDPIGPASERALPATAGRWPLRPQLGWHEVVGTMGEVRGDGHGESRDHLHDGLDIRGDVGQDVRAIADAKVSSPLASVGFGQLGEGLALDRLSYVHMRVGRDAKGAVADARRFQLLRDEQGKPERMRVRRGTRFAAGDVLGSINAMAHVHLMLGTAGYQVNPFLLGFNGFADHQPPQIGSVEVLDAEGRKLTDKVNGRLLLPRAPLQWIVDAWDQVDRNQARRRLGLYSLGWQLLQADGRPMPGFEQPQATLSFTRLPAMAQAARLLYAPDSGITVHGSAETHFRYLLPGLGSDAVPQPARSAAAALPAGDYVLRIVARDFAGNQALQGRDLAVTLR